MHDYIFSRFRVAELDDPDQEGSDYFLFTDFTAAISLFRALDNACLSCYDTNVVICTKWEGILDFCSAGALEDCSEGQLTREILARDNVIDERLAA